MLRSCYIPAGTDTRVPVPVRVAFGEKLGAWFSSLEKITDFKDSSWHVENVLTLGNK